MGHRRVGHGLSGDHAAGKGVRRPADHLGCVSALKTRSGISSYGLQYSSITSLHNCHLIASSSARSAQVLNDSSSSRSSVNRRTTLST